MRRCETCRFFKVLPEHCRRFPPTAVSANQSSYPLVLPAMWCGEYRRSFWRTVRRWLTASVK